MRTVVFCDVRDVACVPHRRHGWRRRAKYPPHCQAAFDAVGLCQLKELTAYECQQAWAAFAPCATEMHQKKLVAARLARVRAQQARKQAQAQANAQQ